MHFSYALSEKLFLVSGPTRPGPVLVVFVSSTHEAANFLVDPRETVTGASFTYWDAGVNNLLEFGDKLIPQNLNILIELFCRILT